MWSKKFWLQNFWVKKILPKNLVKKVFCQKKLGPKIFGTFLNPNHHPLSENRDFSRIEPPYDLRPVCKLDFVPCDPEEKNRVVYLSLFNCGDLKKFENNFFQIAKLRFLTIFANFWQSSRIFKKFSLGELKS